SPRASLAAPAIRWPRVSTGSPATAARPAASSPAGSPGSPGSGAAALGSLSIGTLHHAMEESRDQILGDLAAIARRRADVVDRLDRRADRGACGVRCVGQALATDGGLD